MEFIAIETSSTGLIAALTDTTTLDSAFAGFVAAVTAAGLLGLGKFVCRRIARCQDVKLLRKLLIEGRKTVLEAKEVYYPGPDLTISAEAHCAAQYNKMMRIIGVTLNKQYFGQNLGRPISDGAIVTKVLVIGAGFFQALPLG